MIEYIVMFPQAVPRLVFAFGMMWAWLVFPIPIYGTLWLLLIAYLTVFLPLGVRTISGVMLQIDKSLEECAQMCGAGWGYRIRTVTVPLLWPGLIAAWLLLFVASIRELGASILLMGPHSKVITPSIVESWFASSTELTAAMALIQTLVVAIAVIVLLAVTRRVAPPRDYRTRSCKRRHAPASLQRKPHIEVENLEIHYGNVPAVRGVSFRRAAGRATDAARPVRLRQDHDACARSRASSSRPRARSASAARRSIRRRSGVNIPAEKRGLSMVFQSYAIWPHMTVFENVAYGLARAAREQRRRSPKRCERALDMVQMRAFARAAPRSCPAGSSSASRWRAPSCSQPSVLLFDEPLSNLDAKLRADMRIELRELQHRLGITSVYVTHDLEEALAMSDRIVVMRDGLIEQIGTPAEIYNLPRNAFVADFVGSANLIRGRHRTDLAMGTVDRARNACRTHRLRHGAWTAGRRRTDLLDPHRAPSAFGGAAGCGAKRLAGAGRAHACSRATSRRFTSAGAISAGHPRRRDGAAGGRAGCLHQHRAAACRDFGRIAASSRSAVLLHDIWPIYAWDGVSTTPEIGPFRWPM